MKPKEFTQEVSRFTFKDTVKNVMKVREPSAEYLTHKLYGVESVRIDELLEILQQVQAIEKSAEEAMNLSSSFDVGMYCSKILCDKEQEEFFVIFLNNHNNIITAETLFKGSPTQSIVHIPTVFKRAIDVRATKIIISHNHPSGDPTPSTDDIELTKRMMDAGEFLGIPVLDHIVVGGYQIFASMREWDLI